MRKINNLLVPAEVTKAVLEFLVRVMEQEPEKPDYWSGCGQCADNSREAGELLDLIWEEQPDG